MEQTYVWKVQNDVLVPIKKEKLPKEQLLQRWIEKDVSVISKELIYIGSKIKTDHDKEIDILAMDYEGDLVIIELKRDLTPRDVVAQSLDYAAYCASLNEDDINKILQKRNVSDTVEDLLLNNNISYEDIEINENQKIIIVGSQIDRITERIVRFLSKRTVQINVVTFTYHKENNNEYVSRNILLEDAEIAESEKAKRKREKSFYKKLFENGKLAIGTGVYFKPGAEKIGNNNDKTVIAEINTNGTKCLKYYDGKQYSFSSLRKKIVQDLGIDNINTDWGYSSRYEWFTINDNKSLSDLEES